MKRFTAGAAAVLFSVTAISWTAGAVTGLTGAREAFRRECSRCHEPERALRRSKDEQAWKKTVERMSRYAQSRYKKPIPEEVRTAAVAYLTARYVLEESCTGCHGAERVLKANLDRRGWETTVQTMKDLGAVIVEGKEDLLIDYLTVYGGDGG